MSATLGTATVVAFLKFLTIYWPVVVSSSCFPPLSPNTSYSFANSSRELLTTTSLSTSPDWLSPNLPLSSEVISSIIQVFGLILISPEPCGISQFQLTSLTSVLFADCANKSAISLLCSPPPFSLLLLYSRKDTLGNSPPLKTTPLTRPNSLCRWFQNWRSTIQVFLLQFTSMLLVSTALVSSYAKRPLPPLGALFRLAPVFSLTQKTLRHDRA